MNNIGGSAYLVGRSQA